jgi:hypothetical protein
VRCVLVVAVLLSAACAGRGLEAESTTTSTLTGLRLQCQRGADELGFAVPCPEFLPEGDAAVVGCCVSEAGGDATLDEIFFLDVTGFEPPPPGPVQHLIVEARRVDRAPPAPCFDGRATGELRAGGRDLVLLTCPSTDTLEAESGIQHGEGAHTLHLLGYWDEADIRYVVSVHGHRAAARRLLAEVAASIDLVAPE